MPSAVYSRVLATGGYQAGVDLDCGQIVEPDLDLHRFLSVDRNPGNPARYVDRGLDELYDRQSRALDRDERKRHIRQFEKRLLDEEAHCLATLQYHRILPHSEKLRGWRISPSHYLNQQLDTVWLAE
jgi:peptide/nickel transport system substrate-binding protein